MNEDVKIEKRRERVRKYMKKRRQEEKTGLKNKYAMRIVLTAFTPTA
jgi:hypothetical protein